MLAAYQTAQGNWGKLYARIMLSNPMDDEERFRTWIDEAIEKDEVEAYDAYVNEPEASKKRRITGAKKEAKEAEAHSQKLESKGLKKGKATANGGGDLAAMIQQRQQSRASNFLDDLEAKYATPHTNGTAKKGRGKRRKEEGPPEEAFQKAAERAAKKRKTTVVEEEGDEGDEVVDLEDDSEGLDGEEDDIEEEEDVKPAKRKRGSRAGKKKVRKSARSKK